MVGGRRGQETVLLVKNLAPCPSCDIYSGPFSLLGSSISTATTLNQCKSSTSRASLVAADASLDYASANFTN
jgi:hypothetical protein